MRIQTERYVRTSVIFLGFLDNQDPDPNIKIHDFNPQ